MEVLERSGVRGRSAYRACASARRPAPRRPAVDPAAVQKLERMSQVPRQLQRIQRQDAEHARGTARVGAPRRLRCRCQRDGRQAARPAARDARRRRGGPAPLLRRQDADAVQPGEKVYATEAAPPTVEKTIDFARETIGILLPAADLLYRNAFPLLVQDLKLAAWSARRRSAASKLRPPAVQPAGRRTSRSGSPKARNPGRTSTRSRIPARRCLLSITTRLSDWRIPPAVGDAMFRFVPPKGTQQIRFMSIEPARPMPGK